MLRSNPSASRPAAEHRSSADISDCIVSAMDAIVRKLAEKPKAVREAFRSFARDANADKTRARLPCYGRAGPNATAAFNEAFGTKLTDTEFGQSFLQALERETQKGKAEQ